MASDQQRFTKAGAAPTGDVPCIDRFLVLAAITAAGAIAALFESLGLFGVLAPLAAGAAFAAIYYLTGRRPSRAASARSRPPSAVDELLEPALDRLLDDASAVRVAGRERAGAAFIPARRRSWRAHQFVADPESAVTIARSGRRL